MKLEDELSSIEIFTSNIENPVIKQRVYQVLSWNIIKSTRYKRMFYILSILILLFFIFSQTSLPRHMAAACIYGF